MLRAAGARHVLTRQFAAYATRPPATAILMGSYMSSAHKREWKFCSPMRGEKRINFVAFSPDGSLIAFGDGDPFARDKTGAIRLYDAGMGGPFGSPLKVRDAETYGL